MTTSVKTSCDTSRNGSTPSSTTCALCSRVLESSRSRYCSPAHRQRAFRLRRRGALVAHTVYECSVCGERQVGVRRCEQDNVFGRALGLGGHCTECEQPILLADLLELEVMP